MPRWDTSSRGRASQLARNLGHSTPVHTLASGKYHRIMARPVRAGVLTACQADSSSDVGNSQVGRDMRAPSGSLWFYVHLSRFEHDQDVWHCCVAKSHWLSWRPAARRKPGCTRTSPRSFRAISPNSRRSKPGMRVFSHAWAYLPATPASFGGGHNGAGERHRQGC